MSNFVKTWEQSLQVMLSKTLVAIFTSIVVLLILPSCGGGGEKPAGGGEFTVVKNIQVGATIDTALASKGEGIFKMKCTACHKYDSRLVGPPLREVTKRRTAEYIISMIMHPEQMQDSNDTVKALVKTYMTKMTNQNVNDADARALYEHLRAIAMQK